jgi:hypothetical protein
MAPAVLTVTTAADDITPGDGSVSLREAIAAINAGNNLGDPDIIAQNPGTFGVNDAIRFNIPGAGPHQISVGSDPSASGLSLPSITSPVTLDATTQPGFSAGKPVVVLDGTNAAGAGLDVEANNVTIKGFDIVNWSDTGINVGAFANTQITQNFVGVETDGVTSAPNGNGIVLNGSTDTLVGGPSGAGNVLSGNTANGIVVVGTANATLQGNLVGPSADGNHAVLVGGTGHQGSGILMEGGATNTMIGGTGPQADNTISGNDIGVQIEDVTGAVLADNRIGVALDEKTPLGNRADGVLVSGPATAVTIGGTQNDTGNTIADNGGDGVNAGPNVAVLGNAIVGNGKFGIQNSTPAAPTLTYAARPSATILTVSGTLTAAANTTYRVEFFANTPGPNAQGQTFLGAQPVLTDGTGNASFTANLPVNPALGETLVTATATDQAPGPIFGTTSAFSAAAFTPAPPPSPPPPSSGSPASPASPVSQQDALFRLFYDGFLTELGFGAAVQTDVNSLLPVAGSQGQFYLLLGEIVGLEAISQQSS